jgi:hypothetical protein
MKLRSQKCGGLVDPRSFLFSLGMGTVVPIVNLIFPFGLLGYYIRLLGYYIRLLRLLC